ncbi:hypothetical protein EGP98_04595, partial [bacterium]|nr:hypothetical protein [bacterium]
DLAYEIVVKNTNDFLDLIDEIEVIIDTKGIPFSPRVKSDDGKSYLDCPRVVTDLVYDKAKEWYGDPLPHNIEERISTELYGDAVYKYTLDNIKKENNPIILTGDFNMTINNLLFKEFINELEKIGIKRVNVLEKTYKTHSKNNAIDHIFVSKKMNILKYKVIKDDKYKDFSDHYPIIVFLNRVN